MLHVLLVLNANILIFSTLGTCRIWWWWWWWCVFV